MCLELFEGKNAQSKGKQNMPLQGLVPQGSSEERVGGISRGHGIMGNNREEADGIAIQIFTLLFWNDSHPHIRKSNYVSHQMPTSVITNYELTMLHKLSICLVWLIDLSLVLWEADHTAVCSNYVFSCGYWKRHHGQTSFSAILLSISLSWHIYIFDKYFKTCSDTVYAYVFMHR